MHDNEGQAKLGYRGGVASRTKALAAKTLSIVLGGVVLVSAFVFSIALFAIALTVVLAFGVTCGGKHAIYVDRCASKFTVALVCKEGGEPTQRTMSSRASSSLEKKRTIILVTDGNPMAPGWGRRGVF
jgi:hypothetical protein